MELGQTINGSFEIDRNITIYARLVYINPNYGTQIFPETSKKIENVKNTFFPLKNPR